MEIPDTLAALATGFGAGLSLIVAIGAQNAFVLRQGLRREHMVPIAAVCIASDAVLIAAGVAGVGALIQAAPLALAVVRWGLEPPFFSPMLFSRPLVSRLYDGRRPIRTQHAGSNGEYRRRPDMVEPARVSGHRGASLGFLGF